jgi:hypothetical protein
MLTNEERIVLSACLVAVASESMALAEREAMAVKLAIQMRESRRKLEACYREIGSILQGTMLIVEPGKLPEGTP